LIAGLEEVTHLDRRALADRDVAMVQQHALYPHLTVYENLAFGLKRHGR
jgi:multiple sugar transport system ATP-binding protein